MAKKLLKGSLLFFVLLILKCNTVFSQAEEFNTLQIMFYNVENLFDVYDDTLKNDNDFLPSGVLRWNYSRYHNKINSLYKTIVSAGDWSPPGIVAMGEVENRSVLEDLIYGTYLSKYKYRVIHEDSPDHRGIDVCLIYRSDLLSLISSDYWIPNGIRQEDYTTIKVLYTRFKFRNDTIHIIVNHWPSRRGGVLAGESMRIKIAEMVKEKADSISLSSQSGSKIIILGDFNSTPDDQEIRILTSENQYGSCIINLSEGKADEGYGTYRYQGTWEMIDQVIVSEALLNARSSLYTSKEYLKIFSPDFLLENDPVYPGLKPFSTYRGYRYHGGYSDHLPVIIDIFSNDPFRQE